VKTFCRLLRQRIEREVQRERTPPAILDPENIWSTTSTAFRHGHLRSTWIFRFRLGACPSVDMTRAAISTIKPGDIADELQGVVTDWRRVAGHPEHREQQNYPHRNFCSPALILSALPVRHTAALLLSYFRCLLCCHALRADAPALLQRAGVSGLGAWCGRVMRS